VKHRDLAFGGAGLAISILYYWMATLVPVSQLADAIGPQGLPKVYAVILAALSLISILRSVRDPGSGIRDPKGSGKPAVAVSEPPGSPIPDPRSRSFRAAGMLLIGIVYILLAPWLGYLLSIAGLIFATTYYQGGTVGRQTAVVALCGGVFFWVLFVAFMGIAQPPGFFSLQP
jgi:putative tricarboxylic transport membrane protein